MTEKSGRKRFKKSEQSELLVRCLATSFVLIQKIFFFLGEKWIRGRDTGAKWRVLYREESDNVYLRGFQSLSPRERGCHLGGSFRGECSFHCERLVLGCFSVCRLFNRSWYSTPRTNPLTWASSERDRERKKRNKQQFLIRWVAANTWTLVLSQRYERNIYPYE